MPASEYEFLLEQYEREGENIALEDYCPEFELGNDDQVD